MGNDHFAITFQAYDVIEEYGADYLISWFGAPQTSLLIYRKFSPLVDYTWLEEQRNTEWAKVTVHLPQMMGTFREYLYINSNTFSTLTTLQKNFGNGPHIYVAMHVHVIFCLQRHTTVPLEGCSRWNLLWIQGEYEDCLCKLCCSLFTTDNNQEV